MRRTGSSNPIVQTGKYSNDRCSFLASQCDHLNTRFFFCCLYGTDIYVNEIPVLTLTFLINILLEYLANFLRNVNYRDGKL